MCAGKLSREGPIGVWVTGEDGESGGDKIKEPRDWRRKYRERVLIFCVCERERKEGSRTLGLKEE